MPLEQLWAGWRHDYVNSATNIEATNTVGTNTDAANTVGTEQERAGDEGGCVFCRLAASGAPSVDNGVVYRGDLTFAVLNAYPYASGHLLVLPLRHLADMGELTEDEAAELWATTRRAVDALTAAYRPDGMNLGANLGRAAGAGLPRHLHLHVLPRWSGDTNFMTSVGGVRVMPETLATAWEKLHAAWR